MKLILPVTLIVGLAMIGSAQAALSIGGNPWVDVGTVQAGERIETSYVVYGWYGPNHPEGPYYPLTVTHTKYSGDLLKWTKVRPKSQEVFNPPGSIPPYPEHNVFVKIRIPKWMPSGNYETVIQNKGCFEEDGMIHTCGAINTKIKYYVNGTDYHWALRLIRRLI